MNYSTLLLDADNTIFDFDRCEYLAFRETILFFGFSFDNTVFAAFHDINDSLWKELEKGFITVEALRVRRFSLLLRACFPDADANELGTRMAEVYVQMLSGQTVLLEHSLEDIQLLSAQYTLCVITNGISSVQRNRFAHSPVMPYIQKLYISGEIGAQKPKKAFFEAVLQDLQEKDLHRLAVVGDSLTSDMQGFEGYFASGAR